MDPVGARVLAAMTDPRGLSALLSRADNPAAAKAVAQQFGSLLLQGLWQQNDGSAIGMADGIGGGIVNSMFANAMGQAGMAGDRLGLADLLLRSIEQKQHQKAQVGDDAGADGAAPTAPAGANPAPSAMVPLLAYWQEDGLRPPTGGTGRPAATGTILPPARRLALMGLPPAADTAPEPIAPPEAGDGAPGATPQQVAAFEAQVAPLLRQAAGQLRVSPRILLAQAAIETGWGRAIVGNNLFGIKAGGSWPGAAVTAATHEYRNGQPVATEGSFRSYPSFAASVQDFVSVVAGSPRYRAALGKGEDVAGYAQALVDGGWATDIDYVHKLETVAASSRAAAPFAPVPLVSSGLAPPPPGAPVPLVPHDFAAPPPGTPVPLVPHDFATLPL